MSTVMTVSSSRNDRPPLSRRDPVAAGAFAPAQLWTSLPDALRKLDPRTQLRNPVMFVVWVGSVLVTVFAIIAPSVFAMLDRGWLWFTVLFANLAEAVAEGRGKAQAAGAARHQARHRRPPAHRDRRGTGGRHRADASATASSSRPGRSIPGDGDVVEGIATVDESAITGESAPVVRESGGDRSAVTGGTTVLSDRIVVRITTKPGESFVDRMIALVEGAARQKTPNEIALKILLAVADDHLPAGRRRGGADERLRGPAAEPDRARPRCWSA